MKKSMQLILTSVLIVFVCFSSCKDDPTPIPYPTKTELEKLPPATKEGKNTFGCLINDTAWIPRTTTDAYAVYQSQTLTINADINTASMHEALGIALIEQGSMFQIGQYELANTSYQRVYFAKGEIPNRCEYQNDNTISGTLTITELDRVNHIISGLFEFTTAKTNCDTIRATNGRFDLQYIP